MEIRGLERPERGRREEGRRGGNLAPDQNSLLRTFKPLVLSIMRANSGLHMLQ